MKTKTEPETETIECEQCGCEIDEDHGCYSTDKHSYVCDECYRDYVKTCQLCDNEDVMPPDVSEFILVKNELAGRSQPPGIYLILSRPFILGCMIGSDSLLENDVLFVDRLPKPDAQYEISGNICKKCARRYQRIFRTAYKGRTAKRLHYAKDKWQIEGQRMRNVILRHKEMLRDLECDIRDRDADGHHLSYADAGSWKELKKRCNLPDGIHTYHERVFVEHQGVKIYYCGYSDGRDAGWLTWHPEPRFRHNGHGPDCFSATSLSTYRESKAADASYSDYRQKQWERAAVIKAIEQGILKQEGPTVDPRTLK